MGLFPVENQCDVRALRDHEQDLVPGCPFTDEDTKTEKGPFIRTHSGYFYRGILVACGGKGSGGGGGRRVSRVFLCDRPYLMALAA